MGASVVADPDTRIISFVQTPVDGQLTVDVAANIYSELKDDWLVSGSLNKLIFPLRPVGGDPISPTQTIGKYVFLANDTGWRLQPFDANHELSLVGNIYPEEATEIMWLQQPTRTITINNERSNQALVVQAESDRRIWSIPI